MTRFLVILSVIFFLAFFVFILPIIGVIQLPGEISITAEEYQQRMSLPQNPLVTQEHNFDETVGDAGQRYIDLKLFGFIPIKRVKVDILPFDKLAIGGTSVGFVAKTDGVVVLGDAPNGTLRKGDIIRSINQTPVGSIAELNEYLKTLRGEQTIVVSYLRGDLLQSTRLNINADSPSPLGMWLKDETSGIGILTYVNPANNNFAALGHKLTDFETGARIDVRGGDIYKTNVAGIDRSNPNRVGEFRSTLNQTIGKQGSVLSSNSAGVFGCLNTTSILLDDNAQTLPVGSRYSVRPGRAKLRTSLDGETVEEFDIEIIKTQYQKTPSTKSMIVRITDKRLLERTGGIIHGMSGSPIIQNGKLVGALTHVITSDPTKGYGIYIDFVLP
jgi:stage IV sporulation protein B